MFQKGMNIALLVVIAAVFSACNLFGAKIEDTPNKGPNVALGKPVEASSIFSPTTAYVPENVVDGIWDTKASRWLSSNEDRTPPHWLIIDLLDTYTLTSAEVVTGDPESNSSHAVPEFTLQSWSGSEWVDIPGASVTENEDEHVTFNFSEPVDTDKVRFFTDFVTDDPNYQVVRVVEIMLFAGGGEE